MRRTGSALIELLVVTAIIAILAAILFPVFARAREKARQASCQSNQKQIMLAYAMYRSDYDNRTCPVWYPLVPGGPCGWDTAGTEMTFHKLLEPYMKNRQIWECPSKDGVNFWRWTNNRIYASIGWNCGFDNNRREGDYRKPAEHISCGDTWGGGDDPRINPINCPMYYQRYDGGGRSCANSCPSISTDPWLITEARHNGGLNAGYLDGHVKWGSYQALYPSNRTTDSSRDEMWGLGLR